MAQRRMFSPDIVESDAFLEMPISTQALYFHLGMYADDDGFVNPKKIIRLIGVADDDLKVLMGKNFVIHFENGVIVIKHWKMNNLVRKDWYRPTQYLEQRSQIFLKENGSYTLDNTQGNPIVNESLTEPHRIVNVGKVRLGKDSRERAESSPSYLKEIPDVDLEVFYNRFECDKRAIKSKGEDLFNYCKAIGKTCRDYKAFLLNALKRDFTERKEKLKTQRVEIIEGKPTLIET